jgi:hypothetical protein
MVRQEHPGPLSRKSEIRTGPVGPVVGMGAVAHPPCCFHYSHAWHFQGTLVQTSSFKFKMLGRPDLVLILGCLFLYRGTQR